MPEQSEYARRLEQEYALYKTKISNQSAEWYLDNAEEMVNMKQAYEYLRFGNMEKEALAYIMRAEEPIHMVAGTKGAFELASGDASMELAVYDIYHRQMLDDRTIELYTDRVPIRFHKNISSVDDILSLPRNREDHVFEIERIIEMNARDFSIYADNIFQELPFIRKYNHITRLDENNCWRCLLVHDAENERGLLLCAEGYNYSRYTAYVENTRELDFQNLTVERYTSQKGHDRTIAKPRKGSER